MKLFRSSFLSEYAIAAAGAVFTATVAWAAPSANLEVSISALKNAQGDIVVCLWRKSDAGFPNCGKGQAFKKTTAPASVAKVNFADIPDGQYAVSFFHDEKRIGTPETNFMGMPKSGIGLANNPKVGPLNRPTFGKAAISIPQTKSINIVTRYLF